jgi:hypothetical protein
VAMAHYELHAWCLLVLAWVFVPFYARSRVFTMPEFLVVPQDTGKEQGWFRDFRFGVMRKRGTIRAASHGGVP